MKQNSPSQLQLHQASTRTAPKILVVDDDPGLLRLLSIRLKAYGFDLHTAESAEQALSAVPAFQPEVVVTDLRMPGMDGMAMFRQLHDKYPTLPIIILTAHGSIPDAVEATREGVFSFLTKPFDSQKLLAEIRLALQVSTGIPASNDEGGENNWRKGIIGCSSQLENLLLEARRIAPSDVSVLIQSPSGTGKELLAQAIHDASRRADQPFVAINCTAIPESLFESELFGHAKGAFTGADRTRDGLIKEADGGTLFLDEIGDMPLDFQGKLLRFLQEKQVRPVGSNEMQPVDVRVLSATHHDLDHAVYTGKFREDLYYRLNVITLELPPLSERREDISMLANHFLRQIHTRDRNCVARSYSPQAMALLTMAKWPGNIRQLMNVVEQVAVLATTPVISESLVLRALKGEPDKTESFVQAQRRFERDYLIKILQMTSGNVTHASKQAGRNRTEFYKLLHRHKIDPKQYRLAAKTMG
jgi:two-component system response regulator GlrR